MAKQNDKKPDQDKQSGGKKTESVKALQVSAKRDGFHRAGRPWNGTTHIALDDKALTKGRRKLLEEEPLLVVHEVQVDANEVEPYGVPAPKA